LIFQKFNSTAPFSNFFMSRTYQTYCRIIDYLFCSMCTRDSISWDCFSGWIYRNSCFSSDKFHFVKLLFLVDDNTY